MLTMYSTSWCGYCYRLKSQLEREGIAYEVVDIERNPAAAEYVMGINGGNQTVPTGHLAAQRAVGDPVGDRPGLAGAGAREQAEWSGGRGHGGPLLLVERGQHPARRFLRVRCFVGHSWASSQVGVTFPHQLS